MRFIDWLVNAITTPIRQLYNYGVQLAPGVGFWTRMSLPWKWTLLTFLFLLAITLGGFIKHRLDTGSIPTDWVKWFGIASLALFAIPFLVYHFVRYLMMKEQSRYPDIDSIWYDGLSKCDAIGIGIDTTPLFLFVGGNSIQEIDRLLAQAFGDLPIKLPLAGDSPIAFYASPDGIFVSLLSCSCTTHLCRLPVNPVLASGNKFESITSESGGTIDASALGGFPFSANDSVRRAPSADQESGGTINDPFGSSAGRPKVELGSGTLQFSEGMNIESLLQHSVSQSRQLTSQAIETCNDRLHHLCRRIREARQPITPMNGMLTMLPLDMIEHSSSSLQQAIQSDLAVLRSELQVRVGNTVLVTGMEHDSGFLEMIKRLSPRQSQDNRFGKGAELWYAPEVGRLTSVASHSLAQFEDWVYTLFQADGALKKRNNAKLFELLCRMRGVAAERLTATIGNGFGFNPQFNPDLMHEQFLFGGCYFSANGLGPSEQGFSKNVLRKLVDQQGELEWNPEATANDHRFQFFANLSALIGLASLIAIIAMTILWFMEKSP
jgi:hypothetical protein